MTRRGVIGEGANHRLASWVALALLLGSGGCTSDDVNVTPVVAGELAEPEVAAENEAPSAPSEAEARSRWGQLPMRFEENRGQHDARARYVARQRGLTLFATESALVFSLMLPSDEEPEVPEVSGVTGPDTTRRVGPRAEGDAGASRAPHEVEPAPLRQVGLRMWLEGGAEHAAIEASEPLETRSNYFLGNDPNAWRTDIPNYGALRYRDVRPGVDLLLRGSEDGRIEYDLVVAPGASAELVMRLEGAERLAVVDDGAIEVHVAGVVLRQSAPVAYQEVEGRRVPVVARYRVLGGARVGFEVGAYDRGRVLVIDPVLEYSTYLGGSSSDEARGIAVDGAGAAYVTGHTSSTNFPTTTGAVQTANPGSWDVFVAKLNPAGSGLVYATYLGGTSNDYCRGIAVDGAGEAYVTGETSSANFPSTTGAAQTTNAGSYDAFVAKLNAAGSGLVYATYLGGSSTDYGYGIAVDGAGAAYVTGQTRSSNFPTTTGAVQTTNAGSPDVFVAKLNAAGSGLVYSSYLGGTSSDWGQALAVDAAGAAYVTGYTQSTNFPTTMGAAQTTYRGNTDVFVAKLNSAGSGLVYATYLGGTNTDYSHGLAVDGAGAVYVTGYTGSTNFPTTTGALQTTNAGGADVFVAKLNAAGSGLIYATYLGGTSGEIGYGLAVDGAGAAYVTGQTGSTNFPTTTGAVQTANAGSNDVFVAKLNAAGSGLAYATYLGGTGNDGGYGLAVDGAGAVYVTGFTSSTNFPTTAGAVQTTNAGSNDVFIAKLDLGRPNGTACTSDAECTSGHCTDGVCCASVCSGGTGDCQACSVASGAATDGTCGPTTGNVCDDGLACTTTDACDAGTCEGAASPCDGATSCSETSGTFACSACPAGTFSADGTGATACTPCAAGTWSAAGANACVAWTVCDPGERVASAGTATSDQTCAACAAGTYSTTNNAASCTAWLDCDPGERVASAGTATSDRTCAACTSGYSTTTNAASCMAWTDCDPGERVLASGTATTDRTCTACATGYTTTTNAATCTPWTACDPGERVASVGTPTMDRTCAACAAGTYSTTSNAASCTAWTTCDPGERVTSAGSSTADRTCGACAAGTYSTTSNAASCTSWSSCAAGSYVASAGSSTSDRTCASCASGFTTTTNAASCTPWTDCDPGERVATAPSSTSDRACTACGAGTYSTTTNAATCAAWTSCAAGSYVASAGSSTSDRSCASCATGSYSSGTNAASCATWSTCAAGSFVSAPGSATSDRSCAGCAAGTYSTGTNAPACLPWTSCVAGTFVSSAGSATMDRACSACATGYTASANQSACSAWTSCAEGSFETVPPTPTSDRVCAAASACGATRYEVSPPTETMDRVCAPYTECTATQYQSTAPTATSDRGCTDLTVCGEGQYESGAPSATSDRVCSDLTVCDATQYESAAPTATSDRECTVLTVCADTEYESSAPTATRDRACSMLARCVEGEFESRAATPTSDRECSTCSTCGEGEVEDSACGATADTVCVEADDAGVSMDGGVDGPDDGGVDDGGVDDASADASTLDGGAPDAGEAPSGEDGCGCRSAGEGSMPSLGFLLGLGWMFARRRRR